MSDSLSIDLVTEILARLPVKSLIRCRCVSKKWSSLISNRNFIATHLSRALSNPQYPSNLVVFHNFGYQDCSPAIRIHMLSLDPEIERRSLVAVPLVSMRHQSDFEGSCSFRPMGVIGSANGLFCLIKGSKYVLCNPYIQKAKSFSHPNIGRWERESGFRERESQYLGFGYDSKSDDYKLVTLVDVEGTTHSLAEIYSVRLGKWHSCTAPVPPYSIDFSDTGPLNNVFFNGAVHWPATTPKNQRPFRNLIMSFDMKDEVFREMAMPNSFQDADGLGFLIAVVDGLLALIPIDRGDYGDMSVWVMTTYGSAESWTKQFDINSRFGEWAPIGFRKNGEVLLDHEGHLCSYERNSERTWYLHAYKFSLWLYFDTYVESLALLDVAVGVRGADGTDGRDGVLGVEVTSLQMLGPA